MKKYIFRTPWLFLEFFCFLAFANAAQAEERTFYVTSISSSTCMTGSQYTPANQYTLADSDLIILKGTGLGSSDDQSGGDTCQTGQYIGNVYVNPINEEYSSIACFMGTDGKNGVQSWNDTEIRFYAPKNISNETYLNNEVPLRILDVNASGGNNCKTVQLSLTPTCTSFTYSDWGTCSQNGTQERTVLSSSPATCTGGSSVLTQSCTYVAPICSSWVYSEWGACSSGGTQTRTISSSLPASCTGGSPVLSQSCTPECSEDTYECGEWSSCSAGTQTRTCNLTSNCPLVASEPPAETQSCTVTPIITSVSPSALYPGTLVTVNGSGFLGGSTYGSIFLDDIEYSTNSNNSLWLSSSMQFYIPSWMSAGSHTIAIKPSQGTKSENYQVTIQEEPGSTPPSVSSISPRIITPGDTITITGSNFGASRESSNLVNTSGGSLYGTIVSWTDTQIQYKTSSYSDVNSKKIGIEKCSSYADCLDVVYTDYFYIQPTITSLSVSTGAVGTQVKIYGNYLASYNLGSDAGEYHYLGVYFNGTSADVTAWEDSYITASVPSGATDGVVTIKITADDVSTTLTATGPSFNVLEAISNDTYSAYQEYFKQVNIPEAWGIVGNPRSVTVAVIDDGVYSNHPEFSGKMWQNTDEIIGNGIDDDHNGYIDDRYGWDFVYNTHDVTAIGTHGTQVAGIIGAATNNNVGMAGINPNVIIMPVIVAKDGGTNSTLVNKAIHYAVDNGAEVINLSFGSDAVSGYTTAYDEGISYAYSKNILVVVAAGNGDSLGQLGYNLNEIPQSPVCNNGSNNMVIGVGAVDSENYLTSWSNYGSDCVDIYAPGTDILSTAVPAYSTFNNYYDIADGTSFSAPIVTGIVSLLKAAYPTITSQEAINLLIANSNSGVVDAYQTLSANFTPTTRQVSSQTTAPTTTTTNTDTPTSTVNTDLPASTGSTTSTTSGSSSEGRTSAVVNREKGLMSAIDAVLTGRLLGRILLQVQSVGEAWYVNPTDSRKYYMENGSVAYGMLREFGLGISDADLAKIPVGIETRFNDTDTDGDGLPDKLEEGLKTSPYDADSDGDGIQDGQEVLVNRTNPLGSGALSINNTLVNRLKGRILLQVESRGEAWYINPDDGKRYYMKNGDAAYQIMRFLSLGITDTDLRKISIGEI